MRVTVTPPIGHKQAAQTYKSGYAKAKVLHTDKNWQLLDAGSSRYYTGPGVWQSVIKHHCANINGAPYWMLLEGHDTPTRCNYCNDEMPASIVALFKFQNMEAMR